jgi:hypothetical protein
VIDLAVVAAVVAVGAGVYATIRFFGDSDGDKNRRVRALCKKHPVVEVAAAKGLCRVRGNAVILREVPGYPKVGAYFTRSTGTVMHAPDSVQIFATGTGIGRTRLTRDEPTPEHTKAERTEIGSFAVLDGSAALIVEGEAVVWYLDTPLVRPNQTGAIQIREGTQVDIIGEAEPAEFPMALASRGSYRGGGMAVKMVGTKKKKVWILAHGEQSAG